MAADGVQKGTETPKRIGPDKDEISREVRSDPP
jgi:hypothetical protein